MEWVSLSEDAGSSNHQEPQVNMMSLPVMPIDYGVHLPSGNHELRVSDPRYQAMYNDILLSGCRFFVVTWRRSNQLAKVGVVFHLDDLQVTKGADGTPRYVAQHSACERARIVSVDNPEALKEKSQYLLAKVEFLDSCDSCLPAASAASTMQSSGQKSTGVTREERHAFEYLRRLFNRIIALMHELDIKPRLGNSEFHSHSFWDLSGTYGTLLVLRLQRRRQQQRLEAMQAANAWLKTREQEAKAFRNGDMTVLPENISLKLERATQLYENSCQRFQYVFQYLLQSCDFRERISIMAGLLRAEWRELLAHKSLRDLWQ